MQRATTLFQAQRSLQSQAVSFSSQRVRTRFRPKCPGKFGSTLSCFLLSREWTGSVGILRVPISWTRTQQWLQSEARWCSSIGNLFKMRSHSSSQSNYYHCRRFHQTGSHSSQEFPLKKESYSWSSCRRGSFRTRWTVKSLWICLFHWSFKPNFGGCSRQSWSYQTCSKESDHYL